MSNFPVVRAKSSVCLPRQRDIPNEGVVTLSRVTSVPNLSNMHVGAYYQPSTLYPYRRDWSSYDDWHHDNYISRAPLHWVDRRFNARRYAHVDPIPNSLHLATSAAGYPTFWERYKWYNDYLNPSYWRKHRDANYDRPLWDSARMHQLDTNSQKRAINMYRQGLISFDYLDKKWIEPWALGRKEKDWSDVYSPAIRENTQEYGDFGNNTYGQGVHGEDKQKDAGWGATRTGTESAGRTHKKRKANYFHKHGCRCK